MYRDAIIIGILLSLAYAEITGISPGGIIVPAYFAINLVNPERAMYTLFCAVITSCVVKWVFSKFVIYGRRMYVLCIGLTLCLHLLLQASGLDVPGYISYLVPGILAREFDRQGIILTSVSLVIVTGVIVLTLALFGYRVF